jgi:hypothetical protein
MFRCCVQFHLPTADPQRSISITGENNVWMFDNF